MLAIQDDTEVHVNGEKLIEDANETKHVLQLAVNDRPYEETLMAFSHALELFSKIDCINGHLLERMVYIYMAYINLFYIVLEFYNGDKSVA